MIDKPQLLNDEQIRHFIVNGYVNVTADVPMHIHETIYDKTDEIFAGATDFRGDRQHNPLNNILPLVPELQVVLEASEVRGALTSILGNGYVMHPHRHCHPNFGAACKPKLAVKNSGSTPSGKENSEERLMMPLHKDGHAGGKRPRHRTPRWALLFYYPQPCLTEQGPTCIIPGTQYIREFMLDGQRQRHEMHTEGGNGTRLLPKNYVNRHLVPMAGELGTVWIMHFDMVHSFLQNYISLNRYGMKFVFMRTEQPTAPSWNNETPFWQPPEINHVPYDAELLWTYIWNWMSGKTDLYETDRPEAAMDIDSAITALKTGDTTARMKAANELGFMAEADEAVPALVNALEDSYEPVRRNAIYALGAIGKPAVEPLINALDSEKEAFDIEPILHICDAAHGLAAIGASAVPELITALAAERENVRASAAYALGEMGPAAAEAVDELTSLLTDESEEVRRHAISALGMIKEPVSKTVPALIKRLENREDTDLAFFAAQALTRIGPDATEAVPALREALMSESAYVRGFASEALSRIGTAEALQALVPFLRTTRWFNYVKQNVPAFSIALKDSATAPNNADSLTKLIQAWAQQQNMPLPKPEEVAQESDTQFQLTFSDGRRATARVEGDVLNLYHKRRVEAGFKAYR